MLNQEDTLDCIRRAKQGDESAKEKLFVENSPLIKSIVKRFQNKGVEYEDLYQIGCIGFLKAVNNFDESFGVKFSTYTVPMVIGEIKRYIRDNGAIKVSRTIKILANKINRFIGEYQAVHDESPSIEYIAKKFEVTGEEVVVAIDSSKMPLSLYEKYEDDEEGQELVDKICDKSNEDSMIDKIHISNIIDELSERERKIVVLRFFRDKTQSEVSKILGVSQVQVSRLENKIIDKIRLKY